jgi:hypothetical protein
MNGWPWANIFFTFLASFTGSIPPSFELNLLTAIGLYLPSFLPDSGFFIGLSDSDFVAVLPKSGFVAGLPISDFAVGLPKSGFVG